MDSYTIRLFGAIEVFQNGQPITSFRSQKTFVLLAYLLSQNRPLTRAHLAGLFWPDATQSHALGHLRRALHNLSKNLPGCLTINRRTVAISADAPMVVDIFQFQALVKQNSAESMTEAVALCRAPFLEGIFDPDSPELEQWIERERERWQQETARLVEQLSDAAQGKGQFDLALSYAQKLAAMAPWREENHYRLMQLYVKTGQRQAALVQYETCRQALAAELDISPSPDTTALCERIRQTTAAPHNLPPSATPFIGRQAELTALQAMLAHPDRRLITLIGPGGVGKTRLALALCRQSLHHYLEGVWFVPLARAFTREGMLAAISAALNLANAPGADSWQRLINYLRHKELLLALDNCEQLADAADLLADILKEAVAVKLLATSRRPLALQEEWLFDLEGLSYPEPTPKHAPAASRPAADLLAYEAVEFFNESARRRRPRFSLAANETAVIEICRLAQGNPLALELAAALCRDVPCRHIAEGIRHNLDILQTPLRNLPERHRSPQAVFNHSWSLLDKTARRDYARLSVFQGSFSAAAAQSVAGVNQQALRRLIDHSLLQQMGDGRYEIHLLLVQYAREKLEQDQELTARLNSGHARFYITRLAEIERDLQGKEGQTTWTAVTTDLNNIVTAWQWAAAHQQWELLAKCANSLTAYFLDTGNLQAGIALLDEAITPIQAASARPAALYGRLLAHKARLLVRNGQSDEGRRTAQQVMAVTAGNPDARANGEATYALAFADFNQGNYQQSQRLAEAGLKLAQQNNLDRLAILCLNQAGRCCLESNDLDTAQDYFERTAVLAQTLVMPQFEITANINLSLIQGNRGNYAAAEALLQQALERANQLAYSAQNGNIYLNLGTMCLHQGEYVRGQAYYQAAQNEYRHSGNRINLGLSCHAQASVARAMADFPTALGCFEQALALYRETGAKHNQLIILGELGDIERLLGNYPAAHNHLQDALHISSAIGQNVSRLNLLVKTVWLAVDAADFTGAKTKLTQIDALLPDDQPVEDKVLAYLAQSHYWHYQNNLDEARRRGEMALHLAQEHGKRLLPECMTRLGWILIERGERPYAHDLFTAVYERRVADDQPHLTMEARAGLARIALGEGDLAAALAQVEAILQFLNSANPLNTLVGTQIPALVYLACYEVLLAAGDARATAVLDKGMDFLQERAAGLDETQRQSFWEVVPPNRKLVAAKKKSKKQVSTR